MATRPKNIPYVIPVCFCQKFQDYTKDKTRICGYCQTKNDPFKTNFGNERQRGIITSFQNMFNENTDTK
jgi:hypothetical protein